MEEERQDPEMAQGGGPLAAVTRKERGEGSRQRLSEGPGRERDARYVRDCRETGFVAISSECGLGEAGGEV